MLLKSENTPSSEGFPGQEDSSVEERQVSVESLASHPFPLERGLRLAHDPRDGAARRPGNDIDGIFPDQASEGSLVPSQHRLEFPVAQLLRLLYPLHGCSPPCFY